MNTASFGRILRMIRKDKNYTQTKLSQMLGTAISTISMYECNERLPDYEMMIKIADTLNVSMDVLYGKKPYEAGDEKTAKITSKVTKSKKSNNTPGSTQNATCKTASLARTVTKHESDMLDAYRAHPEMQIAVDKILNIEENNTVTLYAAASADENVTDNYVTTSKDEWNRLKNLPEIDKEL